MDKTEKKDLNIKNFKDQEHLNDSLKLINIIEKIIKKEV